MSDIPAPNSDVGEWTTVDALRFLLRPRPVPGDSLGQQRAEELAQARTRSMRVCSMNACPGHGLSGECSHAPEEEPPRRVRCIVPECSNRTGEGSFEGPICGPCAQGLRTDGGHEHDAASRLIRWSADSREKHGRLARAIKKHLGLDNWPHMQGEFTAGVVGLLAQHDPMLKTRAAFLRLMTFKPDVGYPSWLGLAYSDSYTVAEEQQERDRASDAPFFSEAYTYELWGKDDARTLLALMNQLARALGWSGGTHEARQETR